MIAHCVYIHDANKPHIIINLLKLMPLSHSDTLETLMNLYTRALQETNESYIHNIIVININNKFVTNIYIIGNNIKIFIAHNLSYHR